MKMLKDTLCNKEGKYSRKSLTMLVSFQVLIVLAFIDTMTSYFVSEYIFYSFLGLSGGHSVLTVIDKFPKTKANQDK